MKRTIVILLIASLCFGALFAAKSTKFQKYSELLSSKEYTLRGREYDLDDYGRKGVECPFVIAASGSSYYMYIADPEETVKILLQDNTLYMISDADKLIYKMGADAGYDDDYSTDIDLEFDVLESGYAALDGKNLYYEKAYDDEFDLITYWYDGDRLVAIQDENDSIGYYDSIEAKADASLFTLPSNYEVFDMASMFAGMMSGLEGTSSGTTELNWGDYSSNTDSTWDWTSDWDDPGEPEYEALGMLLGLTEAQADKFDEFMEALDEIDWYTLNNYYNDDTDKYDLNGQKLQDVLWLDSETLGYIQSLINMFK